MGIRMRYIYRRRNSSYYNMESGGRGRCSIPTGRKPDRRNRRCFFQRTDLYRDQAVNTDNNEIVGLYILHPNNVGRCGHICNASYAVRRDLRGEHIGEKLVLTASHKRK